MSHESQNPPVSFEDFRKMIAEQLQVDTSKVVEEASFVDDLLADSIQLVNMMLTFEEQGMSLPMEAAWDIETVGDAYKLYKEHAVS